MEDCPYCIPDRRNGPEENACPWHADEPRVSNQLCLGFVRCNPEMRLKSHMLHVVGPQEWHKYVGKLMDRLQGE